MGRDRKEYKNLHIKFDKITFERLKIFQEMYYKKYNEKLSTTLIIEVAVSEFLDRNDIEI